MVTIILSSKPDPADARNITSIQPQNHNLHIHKDFICYYSPFFDAAFNGNFQEGQTQTMKFDDVDVTAFGVLSDWFYTQKITDSEDKLPDLTTLGRVWILGDRFLIPKLQNMAMDMICDKLYKGEPIGKFCKDASQFKSARNPLIESIVDAMVFASPSSFGLRFPSIPLPIVAKIAHALKKVQTLETRVSLLEGRTTSKDYYVKEAIDLKK
jgi:hypothetical protein